jgi:hypothetical protein
MTVPGSMAAAVRHPFRSLVIVERGRTGDLGRLPGDLVGVEGGFAASDLLEPGPRR